MMIHTLYISNTHESSSSSNKKTKNQYGQLYDDMFAFL